MSKRLLVVALSLLLVPFMLGTASAKTLKIGMMGPLTGPYAADGFDIKNGVLTAIEVINENGGIPGYDKIELFPTDTACDPKQAVSGANKLLNEEVVGVIGAYCSSSTIPSSEVLAEEDITMLTPASTHQDVTDRGLPYMYRLCGRDDAQAPTAAKFILEGLKAKSIYLVDDKTTYSQGLADGVEKAARAMGIKVLGHDHVNQGDKDFSAIITKAKKLNADVFGMYLQNWSPGSLMLIQAKRLGLKSEIISGDSMFHPKLVEIAKSAAEGMYDSYAFIVPSTPEYKAFAKRYAAKNLQIGAYGIYAYDAATVLLKAIKDGGSTDPAKMKKQILGMNFQGASKKIKFQKNGDSGSAYVIFKIINGKYELYWTASKGIVK